MLLRQGVRGERVLNRLEKVISQSMSSISLSYLDEVSCESGNLLKWPLLLPPSRFRRWLHRTLSPIILLLIDIIQLRILHISFYSDAKIQVLLLLSIALHVATTTVKSLLLLYSSSSHPGVRSALHVTPAYRNTTRRRSYSNGLLSKEPTLSFLRLRYLLGRRSREAAANM